MVSADAMAMPSIASRLGRLAIGLSRHTMSARAVNFPAMINRARLLNAAVGVAGHHIRIGKFLGIPVAIHWTWLPFVVAWSVWNRSAYSGPLFACAELAGVFLIVLLHEFGHALTARRLGLAVQEVVLWPLGGFATIEPARRAGRELLVVAGGPLVNLALGPALFLLWWVVGCSRGGDLRRLTLNFALGNVVLLASNLLPIWPLDGGRIAQAVLASRIGITRSHLISGMSGIIAASLLAAWCAHMHVFSGIAMLAALAFVCFGSVRWAIDMLDYERYWGFHASARCPACGSKAINAPQSKCSGCGRRCNPLMSEGRCQECPSAGEQIDCPYCQTSSASRHWNA